MRTTDKRTIAALTSFCGVFAMSRRGHLFASGAAMLIASVLAAPVQAQTAHSSYVRYDVAGRATGTIAADPDDSGPLPRPAVRNTYDARGNLLLVEQGSLANWQDESVAPVNWSGFLVVGSVASTYDILGRKLTQTVKGSDNVSVSLTQYSYDNLGRVECTALRMNPASWSSLPASACTPGTAGQQGPDRITRTVYDTAGQVVQLRKGVGSSAEVADVTYSYTPNGKVKEVVDANGNRARYDYDTLDRLQRWNMPSATRVSAFDPSSAASALTTAGQPNTSDYDEYGYDPNGNRTSLRKRDGSLLSFQYDALNRMTAKIVPERTGLSPTHTRDVHFAYDLRGLQTSARFDSQTGEGIVNAYDGFGRLQSSMQGLDGASRTLGYEYDPNGNRIQLTFADNNTVTYQYDGLDRPTAILRSGSAVASYSYDAAGRRTAMNGGVSTTYNYDAASRLTGLSHTLTAPSANVQWGFQYNPAGQITQRSLNNDAYVWTAANSLNQSYTTNGLNQYTTAGSATIGYDANANLTGDGSSTYQYDIENRLVKATGAKTADLRYDPLGRLYEVTGTSGISRWLYDGDALAAEYDGSGNILRRYVHGTDGVADDPLAWYEGSAFDSSNERRLRSDWQGSIALVSDSGGGNILARNRYDEYGVPQSSNVGRFQYTGQAWLPELGMYHYKARIYSPTLGRFLQTDPIGYDDQINLYAYVGNDPGNATDPSGMEGLDESKKNVRKVTDSYVRLKKDAIAVQKSPTLLGKAEAVVSTVSDVGKLKDAALSAVNNAPGALVKDITSAAVTKAFDSIKEFFGGDGLVARATSESTVVRSQDGTRQVRLDIGGHGDKPHAHIENTRPEGGRPTDATNQHRIYLRDKP